MITIGSVFVLILVGSIVRSMGAGMGCPDWPKCFGSYIPPTSEEQLPDNYLKIFQEKRLIKNQRLATLFTKLGYDDLSRQITSDPEVLAESEFDVIKAWIEYINRLVGVAIGILVFLNIIFSFALKHRSIFIVSIFIFVLTGFQGWVGSLVVSTNLLKGFISFHMLLALLILALLIWMQVRGRALYVFPNRRLFVFTIGVSILFIPQLLLGIEVRSIIDGLLVTEPDREAWMSSLTSVFEIHRSYSWLILIGALTIFYWVRREHIATLKPTVILLITLIVLVVIAGMGMTYFSFPFWLQPVHLLLASGIFGTLFYLTLRIKFV